MSAVFLDLDGTLVDSRPGILASLRHAFQTIGRQDLLDADLTWMIGPPFVDSFRKVGLADPSEAIDAYRSHYTVTGLYDAEVYADIQKMLRDLRADARRLYLATAKPHAYATKVTSHFGLSEYLVREFGPELDGTNNWKGDLLRHALAETGEEAARSVMIGDRHHDIAAAAEVGMPSIAVTWGYGAADEWAGASARVNSPSGIRAALKQILG